jgi:hypothetical protein
MMLTTQQVGVYMHALKDGTVFYVGKGTRQRSGLLRGKKRSALHEKYTQQHGRKAISVYWTACANEKDAFAKEKKLISAFRAIGFPLVNKTGGGEGPSGLKHKNSVKQSISQSQKRNWEDAAFRQKAIERMKMFWSSPDARKAASEHAKRIATPERMAKTKGCIWINDGQKNRLVKPAEIPFGWSKGRFAK